MLKEKNPMKTENVLWNRTWFVAYCCGFMSMWWGAAMAQPVVKVPPACEVLVAGSGPGTMLGFGGVVGSGGVVAMPDPFDIPGGAGDFKIITNGTTGHGWNLLGDISLQTAGGIITSGAGTIQNIESFNKNVRPTEAAPPSTGTLARSKGQVRISYTQPPCNATIAFDILKVYPNTGSGNGYVPPIVGPGCWDPNTVVTYSVDAVASDNLSDAMGTDVYYWEVTDGSSPITPSYTSSDGSSITFTTPAAISGIWTVSCAYGRANPWDGDFMPFSGHTTVESMTIGTPVAVSWATAPPTCLNTGLTTFAASLNPMPGYNYSWAYQKGGSVKTDAFSLSFLPQNLAQFAGNADYFIDPRGSNCVGFLGIVHALWEGQFLNPLPVAVVAIFPQYGQISAYLEALLDVFQEVRTFLLDLLQFHQNRLLLGPEFLTEFVVVGTADFLV